MPAFISRVRGLKSFLIPVDLRILRSHPTRVRGLKCILDYCGYVEIDVAPHPGAWIEISSRSQSVIPKNVAPHPGAWIEIRKARSFPRLAAVAPHPGAWIEIFDPVGA